MANKELIPKAMRDKIVTYFGTILENDPPTVGEVRDVSELAYPKDVIKYCFMFDIAHEENVQLRELMSACLISLPRYQEGVGKDRIGGLFVSTPITEELTEDNVDKYQDIIINDANRLLEQGEKAEPYNEKIAQEVSAILAFSETIRNKACPNPSETLRNKVSSNPIENKTKWLSSIPKEDIGNMAAGIGLVLVGLFLVKGFLSFSMSNFTFFMFLPIGPLLIGTALSFFLIPKTPRKIPLDQSWLIFFITAGSVVFFADQYFAYYIEGSGVGFINWYTDLVEHRSWTFSFRGRNPQTINEVGGFGYVLDAIKIGGILYMGLGIYRVEHKKM